MIKILFSLLFFTFASSASAASYSVNDNCYGDTQSAIAAFIASYPRVDNGYLYTLNGTPTINSTGLMSFRINYRLLTTTTLTNGANQTAQLPVCTSGLLSTTNIKHFLLVLAFIFLYAFGFSVGKSTVESPAYGDYA